MLQSMLKIFSSLVIIFFAANILTGCTPNFKAISHEKAQEILAQEKNYILLDVRTLAEYEKKHLPHAILLPIDEIKKGNVADTLPDKDQKIFVYCWTGRRAEDAAAILFNMGYKNVVNLGGIVDWSGELEES